MNLFVLYVFYICLCCQTSTISIAIYFTNHIFDEYIFEIFYDRKFCFCNFLQPNVFPFQQMMLNRFRSLVVVALGCLQKTSACKLPQHKTVINQIKQRDGRWKVEGGRETACKQQVKDVGKTEGGGERRGEKRTGNVEISSGCEVCVPSWQALALSRSVCVSCRRNRRRLSYMRLQRRTELEKFVSSFFFSLWCRVFSQRSVFLTTLKKKTFLIRWESCGGFGLWFWSSVGWAPEVPVPCKQPSLHSWNSCFCRISITSLSIAGFGTLLRFVEVFSHAALCYPASQQPDTLPPPG